MSSGSHCSRPLASMACVWGAPVLGSTGEVTSFTAGDSHGWHFYRQWCSQDLGQKPAVHHIASVYGPTSLLCTLQETFALCPRDGVLHLWKPVRSIAESIRVERKEFRDWGKEWVMHDSACIRVRPPGFLRITDGLHGFLDSRSPCVIASSFQKHGELHRVGTASGWLAQAGPEWHPACLSPVPETCERLMWWKHGLASSHANWNLLCAFLRKWARFCSKYELNARMVGFELLRE